jgi:hypothetical protein
MVKTQSHRLYSPEQASLRHSFAVWLKKVLLQARLPGVELPELADLNEVNTLLAEREMEWARQCFGRMLTVQYTSSPVNSLQVHARYLLTT